MKCVSCKSYIYLSQWDNLHLQAGADIDQNSYLCYKCADKIESNSNQGPESNQCLNLSCQQCNKAIEEEGKWLSVHIESPQARHESYVFCSFSCLADWSDSLDDSNFAL